MDRTTFSSNGGEHNAALQHTSGSGSGSDTAITRPDPPTAEDLQEDDADHNNEMDHEALVDNDNDDSTVEDEDDGNDNEGGDSSTTTDEDNDEDDEELLDDDTSSEHDDDVNNNNGEGGEEGSAFPPSRLLPFPAATPAAALTAAAATAGAPLPAGVAAVAPTAVVPSGTTASATTASAPTGAAVKKPSILPAFNRRPPKMRIKLSLRTLPTLANRKAIPQPKVAESQAAMVPVQPEPKEPVEDEDDDDDDDDETDDDESGNHHDEDNANDNDNDDSSSGDEEDDDGVVRATVVDSDEEGADDEVVAAIVGEAAKAAHRGVKSTPGGQPGGGSSGPTRTRTRASAGNGGGTPKRRTQPTRAIRMPPIASPALLMALPPMSSTTSASHGGGGPDRAESSLPVPSSSSSAAGPTSSSSSKKSSGQHHHLHADSKPYVTPAAVFDASMEAAGYTYERRTKQPHRGSSVKRTVGDMFDSDAALTLRFPPLVPPELLQLRRRRSIGNRNETNNENDHNPTLPELLLESIPRKRGRPSTSSRSSDGPTTISLSFASMVPTSLTIPYPEDYIQKRIKYADEVDAREQAIVRFQEAQEDKAAEIADAMAAVDDDATVDGSTGTPGATAPPSTVVPASPNPSTTLLTPGRGTNGKLDVSSIPTIPEPLPPPTLADLQGFPGAELYKNDHPLYPPQSDNFVSHLDPQAFHIADGRYFGLSTNFMADPNFVGPNAPGLSGVSTGSGLATSSSGSGGISGAMALTLSTTYNGVTAGALAALRSSTNLATLNNTTGTNNSGYNASGSNSNASSSQFSWSYKNSFRFQSERSSSSPESSPRHHPVGAASDPRPTAAAADLKRLMEQQDNDTDEAAAAAAARMRLCIIRAAVYASRSGRHTQSFLGSNGETYPDVSKAFASHAGVKPCQRCKSNKQGAYHCRLRRRHKDPDYDGGDSRAALEPLYSAPMDSLLERH